METMEYTFELLRFVYIEPYEFKRRKERNARPASNVSPQGRTFWITSPLRTSDEFEWDPEVTDSSHLS
jgi:hypothetical protein